MHHDLLLFLLGLAVLLGSARLLGEAARRLGFPAVVGEITAGLVIGKTLLGRFFPGAYVWLGNGPGEGGCTLHNPHYDFNDELIPVGVAYWSELARRLLSAVR